MPSTDSAQAATLPPPAALAEQGKIHALEGDHALALVYYRIAMHQASENTQENKILSRYFAECALESFEQTGDFESVLSYCDQALSHYDEHPPQGPIAKKDLASIHQRRAVVLLKMGSSEEAQKAIQAARAVAKEGVMRLELLDTLANWIRAQFTIDAQRLEALLRQKDYYAITKTKINRDLAAKLPPHILRSFQPGMSS